MSKKPFFGVATALVTPFTVQGALDIPTLQRLIEAQLRAGIDALVVCGTTGESATLTAQEKQEIFSTAVKLCAGRIPVIAGVGSNDTQHTIKLCALARQCGVDALLVVTPYYNKTTQAGAFQHYQAIARSTDLPILLYNVPTRTGMDLLPQTVQKLAAIPNIVGIKEAVSDMARIAALRNACPPDFAIYTGNDADTLPVLALGGDGVISVASNLAPHVMHKLCTAFSAGDTALASRLQLQLAPLLTLLFEMVNPIPVKALMEMIDIPCGPCRLPLEQLTPKQRDALIQRAVPLLAQLDA